MVSTLATTTRRRLLLAAIVQPLLLLLLLVQLPHECHGKHWSVMTVGELWEFFECDAIFDEGPRPIHSAADWMDMRDAYRASVGLRKSSLMVSTGHGFNVDVEAKHADDEKGRGIFAVGSITKGTLIWSTKYTARFTKGQEYRRFLNSIGDDFACDVLQWAYVQSLDFPDSKTTKAFISADLDEGSFINSYSHLDGKLHAGGPNIGCDPEIAKKYKGGCKEHYFALRDIKDGEELLLDYSDFAIPEGWQWFGL